MDDPLLPVEEDEFVYRRIHRKYYDAELPLSVQPEAFRPTGSDITGLSVFRERFVQPADILASVDPSKQSEYCVARLPVRDLRSLGLSIVPDPDPNGPPGHAVIPELTWQAYQADKRRWKDIQRELAKLASANIVYAPD